MINDCAILIVLSLFHASMTKWHCGV